MPLTDLAKAIVAAGESTRPGEALKRFMDSFCRDHAFKADTPQADYLDRDGIPLGDTGNGARASAARNAILNDKISHILSQRIPVGISYIANVIGDPAYRGVVDTGDGNVEKHGWPHASVIVGRQRNAKKECEYIVRNTYGKTCTERNGQVRGKACVVGHFTIAPDDLVSNTLTLDWIPN